jgi:hypothetical protein
MRREESMDAALEPGRGVNRNIAVGENAERQIDAFIEKRHNDRVPDGGERLAEDLWKASERREAARRRIEEGLARLAWHRRLESVYAGRSEEHGRVADVLEGKEATQPKGAA